MSAPYIEFRNEFFLGTHPNPLCHVEQIWKGAVALRLYVPWNCGQCFITRIRSLEPGQGNASQALKWLCDLADKHQIKLYLRVEPFGDKPHMTKPQLKAWYKRNGFVLTGDLKDEMAREPK
jgi:hypothetical protein